MLYCDNPKFYWPFCEWKVDIHGFCLVLNVYLMKFFH